MKRFQSILCASLLTLAMSSATFAGNIYGAAAPGTIYGAPGNIYGAPAPGNIYGSPGNIYGSPGNIYGSPGNIYGILLNAILG